MRFQEVANISGGKDSDCIAGIAADRQQKTGRPVDFWFWDTGHEHQWTYDHLDRLESALSISIQRGRRDFTNEIERRRLRLPAQWRAAGVAESLIDEALALLHPTGIAYLDMILSKGMFAAGASRKFCTEYLKVMPSDEQVTKPLIAGGISVVQFIGVRAEESKKRANPEIHPRFGRSGNFTMPARLLLYRPILDWTIQDVIDYHRARGIPINPLYAEGFKRVGCFPCVNEKKGAIAIMSRRFPEAIEKLRLWEDICARVAVARGTHPDKFDGTAAFFPPGTVPGIAGNVPIDGVIAWAMTDHGQRRQTKLFAGFTPGEMGIDDELSNFAEEDRAIDQGHYACTGGMGWCES